MKIKIFNIKGVKIYFQILIILKILCAVKKDDSNIDWNYFEIM